MKEYIKNNRARLIITVIHVLLTLVWSKYVFREVGINPFGTKLISTLISRKVELAMTYLLTELFAVILVYFFWKLVFGFFSTFRKTYLICLGLFIVGAVFIGLIYPGCVSWIGGSFDDNVITYADAVRLVPDYWHSIYHSVIYGASLLFCPVNFSIPLVQSGLFVYAIYYIFHRVEEYAGNKKWFVFILYIFPFTLELMCYGHRIMYYTLFALIYITYIWFDIVEKKERKFKEDLEFIVLGSFLSVYRSEGMIIGLLLFFIYQFFRKKKSLKVLALEVVIFLVMVVALKMPQKVGDIRYYGKDYQIINTCNRLRVIFNNEDEAVLNYPGAVMDIIAISDLVPTRVLAQYGEGGYRRYNNTVKGNPDINQSCAGEKTDAYLKAYRNIMLHNPKLMGKYILESVYYATTNRKIYFLDFYTGEDSGVEMWTSNAWDIGRADMSRQSLSLKWSELTGKLGLYEKVREFYRNYISVLYKMRIILGFIILLALFNIFLFVKETVFAIKKKEKEHLGKGLISLTLLALLLGTIVTMPDGLLYYFVISIYLMTCIVYFSLLKKSKVG